MSWPAVVAVLAGIGIVAGGGVVAWLLHPTTAAPSRARQYTAFNACLLTDSGGITAAAAAPVWAGMQSGSDATRAKVSFLAVVGPPTADNIAPYLNTLIGRHCDLVLAVGGPQVDAVMSQAPSNQHVHFVVVAAGPGAGNVAAITPSTAGLSAAVHDVLVKATNGTFTGGPVNTP